MPFDSNEVSIARCETYDPAAVKAALLEALAPIHGLDWVTPGITSPSRQTS